MNSRWLRNRMHHIVSIAKPAAEFYPRPRHCHSQAKYLVEKH
jgi:hypothetical protein